MSEGFDVEGFKRSYELAIRTTRASERLKSLLASFGYQTEILMSIGEVDPELLPELTAIKEHLMEAIEAADRAAKFLDARLDAS